MIRINIYITENQKEKLKKEAKKRGIKFSELVRRILDKHIENE